MDLTSPLPFRHQREVHLPKRLEIPSTALLRGRDNMDSTVESSPSPHSHSPPTSTPPPRSPLPPHKLANIANALGVNTPMPAFFRSPSPSGSPSFRAPSRYLLHVVPPVFLPSDEDDDGSDPDGASTVSASSYRSQFRRGTLIPLYPTLHSQLGAIAREYNLPSTGGLVLYLVQSSQDGAQDGPRITEDVWKLLWHKALQAERQDSQPRSVSALNLPSGRSTPTSPANKTNRDVFQPLSSISRVPYPSPSTSSTPSSEVLLPLSGKNNASTSDLDLIASEYTPNPFLPILGKVEFDIDRRKAGWFDAWIHGKRERSRWRSANDGGKLALELPERADSRSRLRPGLQTDMSPRSENSEYMVLDDGEGERTAVDDDEDLADRATIVLRNQDPLADVFGNDAATWDEMHAGRQRKPTGLGITSLYPKIVTPPGTDAGETEGVKVRDEDEVRKIWDENKRPKLSLQPPDSRAPLRKGAPPPLHIHDSKRRLPSGSATDKSPDTFLPYLDGRSLSGSSGSPGDQYSDKRTKRRTGMVFGDLEVKIVAEPEEMTPQDLAHRSSQIVMKHKLDQLEKQLAQLSPRQLNEHERPRIPRERSQSSALHSAPPGVDRFKLSPPKHVKGARSYDPSSRHPDTSSTLTPAARQVEDSLERTPRKDSPVVTPQTRPLRPPEHKRAQSSQSSSGSSLKSHHEQPSGLAWPSSTHSPRSHLPPSPSSPPPTRLNARLQERVPPQLTFKRASDRQRREDVSEETKARGLDDDPDIVPSLRGSTLTVDPNSPVIPLSPDPFGKRPVEDLRQPRVSNDSTRSTETRPPSRLQSSVLPPSVPENAEVETQRSRFSADSEQGFEQLSKQRRARSSSVMSVRGIRNLWRKSTVPSKAVDTAPPVPLEPSPPLPSYASSQHSRGDSSVSQRSVRSPTERMRRPSAALRPDSGMDPFQFDNTNIYKSSMSGLASAATGVAPSGANRASAASSIGKSKGILKGWQGHANPSDAEVRKMRHPSPDRTMSTVSASLSDLGERSPGSQQSSPPSSPPDTHHASGRNKQTAPAADPGLLSHSLPSTSTIGLTRYPEAIPPISSSRPSFDDGSTSQFSEFEFISPPRRSTPSSSYTGEVS